MRICAYYAHAHYAFVPAALRQDAFVPAALRQDAFVHARILISGGGGSCRRQRKSAAPLGGARRVVARWVRPKVEYDRFIIRFTCIRVGAGVCDASLWGPQMRI